MDLLNNIETDVAKEVINIGLGKAADSLSFFSQQKVIIRNSELYFKTAENIENLSNKKGDKIYILTTEVIGDMTGDLTRRPFGPDLGHFMDRFNFFAQ